MTTVFNKYVLGYIDWYAIGIVNIYSLTKDIV